jgi:hypothetical protein
MTYRFMYGEMGRDVAVMNAKKRRALTKLSGDAGETYIKIIPSFP